MAVRQRGDGGILEAGGVAGVRKLVEASVDVDSGAEVDDSGVD